MTEGTRPVRPRTPVEQSLCKLWAALAGADEVGIDDDFFRLGGDSIAAIRLIARIRRTFAVEIPFGDFVRNPTVAATAQSLEEATPSGPQSRPIPTVPPGERLPLSFVQERIWVSERLLDEPSLFNCPACLRLVGPLDVRSLEASLNETVRRHDVLRSRLPAPGGHVELVIDPERSLALEPVALPPPPGGCAGAGHRTAGRRIRSAPVRPGERPPVPRAFSASAGTIIACSSRSITRSSTASRR